MTALPCTTYGRRKRHYATDLPWQQAGPIALPGRSGLTFCGQDGYDQDRIDAVAARSGTRRVVIADLPECRLCARKLGGAA